MKRFVIAVFVFCCVIMASSCIDEQFDLSDINTEDITIGSDESEFLLPVASISITAKDICQGVDWDEVSIKELYETISVWFPEELPDNATFVDVERLMNDDLYFDQIFDAMYEELRVNEQKRVSVSQYVVSNYREELSELLVNSSDAELASVAHELNSLSDADAEELLEESFLLFPDEIKAYVRQLLKDDIPNLNLKDISIDIPALKLSEEVEELLSANLDAATEYNPVNALYLYGSVNNGFPFNFHLHPSIENTMVDMGEIIIDQGNVDIDEIRIYKEDLQTILDGAHFQMPITVDRYYLYEAFDDDCEITIHLSLRKTGGLKM